MKKTVLDPKTFGLAAAFLALRLGADEAVAAEVGLPAEAWGRPEAFAAQAAAALARAALCAAVWGREVGPDEAAPGGDGRAFVAEAERWARQVYRCPLPEELVDSWALWARALVRHLRAAWGHLPGVSGHPVWRLLDRLEAEAGLEVRRHTAA